MATLVSSTAGLMPTNAYAAPNDIPGLNEKDITDFLVVVAQFALQFVLVVAAIFIILAGYTYITSLGNEQKIEQAKMMLLYTIIGVMVVLGAYLIVNTFVSQVTIPL
jgi:hypothetical protein